MSAKRLIIIWRVTMIKADNLTMVYGKDFKAVDDLSFEIKPGEIVGFAGPNGAGKTTVIKMLTGILKPTEGMAVVNGFDIVKEPLKAKESFAYVADNPDIFLQLTGIEYINYIANLYRVPLEGTRGPNQWTWQRGSVSRILLGLPMREYSHGMRQKTMVIAALIHNPPAWILDEPMTGLDPTAAFELKQMMKEHAAKGNAVLFSTHVLEVAEKLCDRIMIINHGQNLYQGTVEDLEKQHPGKDLEAIFIEMIGMMRMSVGGSKEDIINGGCDMNYTGIRSLMDIFRKNSEMQLPETKGYRCLALIAVLGIMIPCVVIVGLISYVMTEALIEVNNPGGGMLFEMQILSAFPWCLE